MSETTGIVYAILISDPRAHREAFEAALDEYPARIKWLLTMYYEFHRTPDIERIDMNTINFSELFKKLLGEETEEE